MFQCIRCGRGSLAGSDLKKHKESLTGTWADGQVTIVQGKHGALTGTWTNGSRPPFYGKRHGNHLTMTFPDDGTFTAKIENNGNTLDWSNNTTWNRSADAPVLPSLSGVWANCQVQVTESACGQLSGIWLQGNRVPFSGTRQGNFVVMTFPDDATFTATITDGGNQLNWSNNTTWTRTTVFPSLTGTWSGGAAHITENANGTLSGTWKRGIRRPDFYGNRVCNTVTMTFPDDATYVANITNNGNTLMWSNNTIWNRE